MDSKLIEQIIDIMVPRFDPDFILVFGSYAKGYERADSDLDIAFYCGGSPGRYETFLVAQELADALKMEVDLIDLKGASTVFQAQIYTSGITIYSKDEDRRVKEQMKALSMYAKLNEERKAILDGIDERGTIL
ncbi:MAG: nucleotidyltransferase domain-containing protein [Bacillus sp. (in: firmicutes)]